MSDADRQPMLWSIPGSGVLAREDDLVLLSSIDDRGFVESLLGLLTRSSSAGGDGRGFTEALAAAVEGDQFWGTAEAGPAVLGFGPSGHGLAVMVSGTAWAEITTTLGTHRLVAGQPSIVLRGIVGVPVRAVRGGLASGTGPADRTDRFSRLDRGTVRASGLSYSTGALAQAPLVPAPVPPASAPAPVSPPPASAPPASAPPEAAPPEAAPPASALPEAAPPASAPPEAAPPATPPPMAWPPVTPSRAPQASAPAPQWPPAPAPAAAPPAPAPAARPPAPAPAAGPPTPASAAGPPVPAPAPGPSEHDRTGPAAPQPAEEHASAALTPTPAPALAGEPPAGPGTSPAAGDITDPGVAGDRTLEPEPLAYVPPPAPPTSYGPATGPDTPAGASATAAGGAPAEHKEGALIILGVYCKNGHFGAPDARSCAVCGVTISRRSAVPQPGPRPPLGVLVLDDGATVEVDGDYVIGRDPARDPSVAAGDARPLRIVDAESTVSRVHARLHLEGWQVLLTDLGSANGTRIRPPGAKSERPLDPEVPVPLQHGTRVFVGEQGLRYEPAPWPDRRK